MAHLIWFQEKLFLTENNLQLQLDQLEAESGAMGQTDEQTGQPQTKLEVTEMNSKKLTINIEVIVCLQNPKSLVLGKPNFCLWENKDTDQVCSNREADQPLCFSYVTCR